MKSLVIIPAFNEGQVISETLSQVKKALKNKFDILVVDDGSTDNTFQQARGASVTVLHHRLNRGLGGALGTGLAFAKSNNYDLAVTFDADGQHDPADIFTASKLIEKSQADVVIGSRTTSRRGHMPWDRKIINLASNILTWVLFGIWTTDSQSGFRAFSKRALNYIQIKTEGMEVSSEIFSEIKKHRLQVAEVPIHVIYTEYSRRKGQSNLNAFNILGKLLLRLFR